MKIGGGLLILSVLIATLSCDNHGTEPNNFFGKGVRFGIWVTDDNQDTLEFIDGSHLVRKGPWPGEFTYKIEGDDLMTSTTYDDQTFYEMHRIRDAKENQVSLQGMTPYFTYISPPWTTYTKVLTYIKR